MAKGTATLIVSFLALSAISLWLFTTRIVSVVAPPLINNEILQIDSLEISSIGWSKATIIRLSGHADLAGGRIRFDLSDAVVHYNLYQLRPGSVEVKQGGIAYEALNQTTTAAADPPSIQYFPPEVVINRLRFSVKDSPVKFEGFFQLSATAEGFSALTRDEWLQLEVAANAKLSDFQVRMEQSDGTEIASAKIKLGNMDLAEFDGSASLDPLLVWIRGAQVVPNEYRDLMIELQTAAGSVHWSARPVDNKEWQAQINLKADDFSTPQFYGSADLRGNLILRSDSWEFTCTDPSALQIQVPGNSLDDIATIGLDLPTDYSFHQSTLADTATAVVGSGEADFYFRRSDGTDLRGRLAQWQSSGWRDFTVDMRNLRMVSPYALNADNLISAFTLTRTLPLAIKGTLNVSAARADNWPAAIPGLDLHGAWTWSSESIDINGRVNWGSSATAKWSLVKRDTSGSLQVELNQPLVELSQPLQKFLTKQKWDAAFSGGSLTGQLNWAWENAVYSNRLELAAADIDLRLQGIKLRNSSIRVSSSDLVARSLLIESSIPLLVLANDMEATDIDLAARWQNGLYVDRADWSIFGGAVKMKPVFLDLSGKTNVVELKVNDINLDNVLQMLDQEGLKGSGRLSGTIPLQFSQDGIAVNGGFLKSDTKGTLSYTLGDVSAPQLDNIALQALQDFRYDALDVELNYETSGNYTIRSRIEGRNPQLYDGYPIAFNVNLSGTLPGLLRASLITGDFHSEILKQIQQEKQ